MNGPYRAERRFGVTEPRALGPGFGESALQADDASKTEIVTTRKERKIEGARLPWDS